MTTLGLAALLTAGVLAGCGDETSRDDSRPATGEAADDGSFEMPEADESTQPEAEQRYADALAALMAAPFSFTGDWVGPAGAFTITADGSADPDRQVSQYVMEMFSEWEEGISLETRTFDDRVLVRSPMPQHDGVCWFDYGSGNELVGQSSWIPGPLSAIDGTAVGAVVGEPNQVVVEADAVNLAGAINGKLARAMYVEEPVPVPVLLTILDGVVRRAEYDMGDAVQALVDAGAEPPAEADLPIAAGGFDGTVTLRFTPEETVEIELPADDTLMDASGVGSAGASEPEDCAALG